MYYYYLNNIRYSAHFPKIYFPGFDFLVIKEFLENIFLNLIVPDKNLSENYAPTSKLYSISYTVLNWQFEKLITNCTKSFLFLYWISVTFLKINDVLNLIIHINDITYNKEGKYSWYCYFFLNFLLMTFVVLYLYQRFTT